MFKISLKGGSSKTHKRNQLLKKFLGSSGHQRRLQWMPTQLTADVNTASEDANAASKDGKFSSKMLLFEIQIGSITTDSFILGLSTFLQQFLYMLF